MSPITSRVRYINEKFCFIDVKTIVIVTLRRFGHNQSLMKKEEAQGAVWYVRLLLAVALALFFVVPFQGLITMWPASLVGYQPFWQVVKELVLTLPLVILVYLVASRKEIRESILHERVFILMAAYAGLHGMLFLFNYKDTESGLAGLLLNLRYMVFFLLLFVGGYIYKIKAVSKAVKYISVAAVLVSLFGVSQMTLLHPEALSHVGYNGDPIPARFSIDDDLSSIRIASTTRGPNSLGAYLIVTILLVVPYAYTRLVKMRGISQKDAILTMIALLPMLVALYGSHSRSAFVGTIVAICVWLFLKIPGHARMMFVAALAVLTVIGGLSAYAVKDTHFFRSVILHDIEGSGGDLTSNQGHIKALVEGLSDIKQDNFLGCGPGCAGPASFRSENGAQIAENYYIQIAQEVGAVGLLLFMSIIMLVAAKLYALREKHPAALALLASLAGVSVVNLFLHSWADETLAYTWWGLAGLLIGSNSHLGSGIANAKRLRTSVPRFFR